MRIADLTTLRVGGKIADYRRASSETDIINIVTHADESGTPLLIIGGGSNIFASDDDFDGVVLHIASTGTSLTRDACSGGTITVAAGQSWDEFVASVVEFGFSGVEALSGIPGSVGATPIQNVGAYGQQVSDSIARVRTYDRKNKVITTFANSDCGFGYRTSRFKEEPDRYVILDVTFQLLNASESAPIQYAELAAALGVEVGQRRPLPKVRETVLQLRSSKGMVLDPSDCDTWSAGSFFINPEVEEAPVGAPSFPYGKGFKVSAAWLIDESGYGKGYLHGGAGLSTKHSLALTNRGSATSMDILELAREVQKGVKEKFGITLVPEVRFIGHSL